MANVAVIFAGGTGTRMGVDDLPKQFLEVVGKPIIIYTLEHFERHPDIDGIVVVCLEAWIEYFNRKVEEFGLQKIRSVVPGDTSGMGSVYKGLVEAGRLYDEDSVVLVHDGVRPLIDADLITRNIQDTRQHGNSITSTICNETFIISENGVDIDDIPLRSVSYNAQAPQAFVLGEIIDAHNKMREISLDYDGIVDCCTLYHKLNRKTYITEGVRGNIKVTNPVDIYILRAWLEYKDSGESLSAFKR